MKGIVSFDLDMTLLDHHSWEIRDSALKALELLRDRYYVVLGTGRDMDSHYSRQYVEILKPDAIIHLNGTKVTVGDRLLYRHQMPEQLVSRLLTFAQERNFCVGVTKGDDDYYIHPELLEQIDLIRWGECGRQFRDPWLLPGLGVQTLCYIDMPERTPDGVREIESAFPELKLPRFAGDRGADILEKTVSKADGLERLCAHFGVRIEDCYAFGDSMNDLEIIRAAGCGVAMGNGVQALKDAADYVTEPIDQDGVWNACRKLGLI